MRLTTLIVGFGRISQGFVSVLSTEATFLKDTFGLELPIVGAVEGGRDGGRFHSAFSADGLDIETLLRIKRGGRRIS